MSLAAPPTAPPPAGQMHRFTVDEYHRMIQVGVLTEDDPVELLEGWIVSKMPHTPAHDLTIELIDEVLSPVLPSGWRVRIQSAITTDDSEPEPDLVIVRSGARNRTGRHPGPADIALLIEVSDSSLKRDRNEKARLYARARISPYWIVNLEGRQVEVLSEPFKTKLTAGYRQRQVYGIKEAVPLPLARRKGTTVRVRDLLG